MMVEIHVTGVIYKFFVCNISESWDHLRNFAQRDEHPGL